MNEVLQSMMNEGLENAIQEASNNADFQEVVSDAVGTVAADAFTTDIDAIKAVVGDNQSKIFGLDNRIDALEATRVTTGDVVKIAGVTALIAIPVGIGAAYAIKKWVAPKAKEWFAKKPEKAKVVADVETNVVEEE